jgi:hypothetical protein
MSMPCLLGGEGLVVIVIVVALPFLSSCASRGELWLWCVVMDGGNVVVRRSKYLARCKDSNVPVSSDIGHRLSLLTKLFAFLRL